jgi:hypothetical protein
VPCLFLPYESCPTQRGMFTLYLACMPCTAWRAWVQPVITVMAPDPESTADVGIRRVGA